MKPSFPAHFNPLYESHLKHLRLKGLRPKTIEAYARAMRRIGAYFDYQVEALSEAQLLDYFSDLLKTHSWGTIKLDLYGLKFFYQHVLHKPWVDVDLVKAPKSQMGEWENRTTVNELMLFCGHWPSRLTRWL